MNDRFKFRFWDKETQTMQKIPMVELRHRITLDKIFADDRVIFMQCTGLKDKNDKLIYEGDIVKNNQNSLYSVEFEEFEHQTKFCLKRVENPDYYPHISTWQGIGYKDQKNYEVIGNIYENKELLQECE